MSTGLDGLTPDERFIRGLDATVTPDEIAWVLLHSYPGIVPGTDYRADRLRGALALLRRRQADGKGLAPMVAPNPGAAALHRARVAEDEADGEDEGAVLAAYHDAVGVAFGVAAATAMMAQARTKASRTRARIET